MTSAYFDVNQELETCFTKDLFQIWGKFDFCHPNNNEVIAKKFCHDSCAAMASAEILPQLDSQNYDNNKT